MLSAANSFWISSEFYGHKKAQKAQTGNTFRQDKDWDSEGIFLTTHGTFLILPQWRRKMAARYWVSRNERRIEKVLEARPVFVLIQFGHNASHAKGQPEATDAATDFCENLRRYVREACKENIKLILVTPVCRRTFRKDETKEVAAQRVRARAIRS